MHLQGTIDSVDVMGHPCWFITTRQLKHYEIYSEDPNLLRKGLKVELDAVKSQRETVCQIGQLIDVISYRVVD